MFGYKQHTMVDDNGLVIAVETTAANQHDSKPMLLLLDKTGVVPNSRIHADKAYSSQNHCEALKERSLKNAIQNKAMKNKQLTDRHLQRNRLISRFRYVVERTFGSQVRWLNSKNLRYRGLAKAHTWHTLQAIAYNLKRLPKLFVQSLVAVALQKSHSIYLQENQFRMQRSPYRYAHAYNTLGKNVLRNQ